MIKKNYRAYLIIMYDELYYKSLSIIFIDN
jgi:hypothetical protein